MSRLSRLAVGTLEPDTDSQPLLWALMDAFRRSGVQIQSFLSQARFPWCPAEATITGLGVRHLDSWLMSPDTCHRLFLRGAQGVDLALVEGCYVTADTREGQGGRLEPLCRWLDLPRLALVNASTIPWCRLPRLPQEVDGVLLDRVVDADHFTRLATDLESLWKVPVLGGLEALPALRAEVRSIGAEITRRASCVTNSATISRSTGNPTACWRSPIDARCLVAEAPGNHARVCAAITVAIAYDEAFNCYFPDVLDLLERKGLPWSISRRFATSTCPPRPTWSTSDAAIPNAMRRPSRRITVWPPRCEAICTRVGACMARAAVQPTSVSRCRRPAER